MSLMNELGKKQASIISACLGYCHEESGREDIGQLKQFFDAIVETSIRLSIPIPIFINGDNE